MSTAIPALRAAIQARLSGDPDLSALIGAGRIHDEAPRARQGVYVVHGEVEARDWSTELPACRAGRRGSSARSPAARPSAVRRPTRASSL